jgi:site-specific recombinase XerD
MTDEIIRHEAGPPAKRSISPAEVYIQSLTSPASRRVQRSALGTVAGFFGDHPLELTPWQQIEYRHMVKIRAVLAEHYAPATANRLLTAVRGVMKTCWRMGLISQAHYEQVRDTDPVRGSRTQKGRMLTTDELSALFRACDSKTLRGARDAAIFTLTYSAGMRRDEVTKLRPVDIDFQGKFVRVHGKGNKERDVYVQEKALSVVDRWIGLRGAFPGPLFVRVDKQDRMRAPKPLSGYGIDIIFQKLAVKAGVKNFTPHDLRRTFASQMLDNGVDLATVQLLMGHSDPSTTSMYDRRGEKRKSRAAKKLPMPFDPPDDPPVPPVKRKG